MIPESVKIALFGLISTVLGIFLFSFLIKDVHADVGEKYQVAKYEGTATVLNFGNTTDGYCQKFTLTNSVYIASSTARVGRILTPGDYLYGAILDTNKNVIATSTNWVLGSTLSTSQTYVVFNFENFYIASSTEFYQCVRRSGARDATNYFKTFGDSVGVSPSYGFYITGTTTSSLGKESYTQLFGYTYFPVCTGGGTLECDMASTTEAVYAVGYTTNYILGFALFLVFFYLGYRFIKYFL